MANGTIAALAYLFKHMYESGVSDESKRLHPTIDGIPTIDDFGGDTFQYAVKINNAQNITSGALAVAQAVGTASKGVQFTMSRVKKLGTISLDIEALLAAKKTSDGAFATLAVNEVDGFVSEFYDRLGFDIFRDSTGNRGQIAAINGNVLTMVDPDTVRNFKVGMLSSAATGAGGAGARVGQTPIAGLDMDGGTITLTNAAAIAALAVGDYMFAQPEIGSNLEGFELCTPLVAPAPGDNFRTKDRSINTSLLAGSRINDASTMVEENAGKIAVKIRQNGGRADTLVLNPQRAWEMLRRLGAKVMYQGAGGTAEYGFETAMISSPAGTLKLVSDPDCPTNRGRVYLNASHKIKTLQEFVHIANEDGNYNLRLAGEDSLETRVRSMSQYYQTEPRNHGVFAI